MPRRMSSQRDPKDKVLRDLRRCSSRKNIRLQVRDELGGIRSRAMETTKHVLCVAWVPLTPCFVVECVDQTGAVVTLVEGYGYEAFCVA
jgi:hypothetical protein